MISMYAEYSGRTLYVALSSDTIDGAKNGDTLYEMDTGKRYVYNESNDAWDEQPEGGGGGGGLMEEVHPTFKNNRASTVAITYARLFSSLSGYVNGSMNISANSEKILDLLNQDGYLIFRSNVNPTSITYGNETLPLVVSVDSGYYCKIPYKGDEEVYQMYF